MSREPKSPYRRHNKWPYRYSELYDRWKRATLAGDEDAMATADAAFRKHWDVPMATRRATDWERLFEDWEDDDAYPA